METRLERPPDPPVLYRDEHLLAIDKPAGLAVHRGWAPERDVVVTRVADAFGVRPHPVHRLDRATSGVLLLALSPEAARRLGEAFAERAVDKRYLALVRGVPAAAGVLDHPVPSDEDRASPRVPAVTAWTVREPFGRYTLVEARPLTGRLHQIRRHFKHLSCPLVGDVKYGKGVHNRFFRERFGLHRLFLHAAALGLRHPMTGEALLIEAPLPAELAATLAALRAAGPELETP